MISPTDITVYPGQIIALLGLSGCGKSTMLRMLTGLSPTSDGSVYGHGHPVRDEAPNVSIVFQNFVFLPWLTMIEDVKAPLEVRGVAEAERHKRALPIIEAVGLKGLEPAYPKERPAGMKQLVAVARAVFGPGYFEARDCRRSEWARGSARVGE